MSTILQVLQILLVFAASSVMFSSSRNKFIFCLKRPSDSAMSELDQSMVGICDDKYTAVIVFLILGQVIMA